MPTILLIRKINLMGLIFKTKKTFIAAIILLSFNSNPTFAQWALMSSSPNQPIVTLRAHQNAIYAAALSNTIFKSVDLGRTWSPIVVSNNSITIESIEFIDNKIFVGTNNTGIFQSADNGLTWQNTSSNPFSIKGFVKKGNRIYAATLGSGVYVYDSVNTNWLPFNNSLRLNEAGSVVRIASSTNYLFITSGGNGGFHTYNFDNNRWEEDYFYGSLRPGLLMNDLENRNDTITVVNGKRIIKSVNSALTWLNDNLDAINGVDRIICNGINDQYIVTNTFGGAWVQKRKKHAPTGTSWADGAEFIPDIYSYNMLEFDGKLFLATHQGIYTKDETISVNEPNQPIVNLKLFPNPTNEGVINVRATKEVKNYIVCNNLGQIVCHKNIGKNEFTIDLNFPNGVYFIAFSFDNLNTTVKKVMVK